MATFGWPSGTMLGNNDSRVSSFLKTWIQPESGDAVCGVTGPGTSQEIQANWQSPFEGESLGNKFQLAGGMAQSITDQTLISTLNSRQVWQGNQPTKFSVELKFYALRDPQKEVMDPIRALERMSAPEVSSYAGVGRIPGMVTLCIGAVVIYPNCVIESLSIPYDKEVARDGYWIRSTVTMQISTVAMLNKSDIK